MDSKGKGRSGHDEGSVMGSLRRRLDRLSYGGSSSNSEETAPLIAGLGIYIPSPPVLPAVRNPPSVHMWDEIWKTGNDEVKITKQYIEAVVRREFGLSPTSVKPPDIYFKFLRTFDLDSEGKWRRSDGGRLHQATDASIMVPSIEIEIAEISRSGLKAKNWEASVERAAEALWNGKDCFPLDRNGILYHSMLVFRHPGFMSYPGLHSRSLTPTGPMDCRVRQSTYVYLSIPGTENSTMLKKFERHTIGGPGARERLFKWADKWNLDKNLLGHPGQGRKK
ncbi:hypothetical protein M426DRAFT_7259 [Hypoxylon sp. CI-4A]|nr:hypothetical protein M426DRAFT_7259 [Hypoxylon sp. CI-4A]